VGWAVHPQLSDYPVLVHVVRDARILKSVVADQPCPPGQGEISPGRWFSIGLAEFELTQEQLGLLGFRIGETDEAIAIEHGRKKRRMPSEVLTVERIINANGRRAWVNGATYVEAEQAGLNDATIVDLLYRDTLGRPADPQGLSNYVFQRQQGISSFKDIRKSMVESEEYQRLSWHVSQAPGAIFSQGITLLAASAAVPEEDVLTEPGALEDTPLSLVPWPTYQERLQSSGDDRTEVDLPLDSVLFGSGWHRMEDTREPPFRWMEAAGLIFSPMPRMACARIELQLSAVYGAHRPMLRAFLDDQEAQVRILERGDGFSVTISPNEKQRLSATTLRIESLASGCPLLEERGDDNRVLSISVDAVRWSYLAAP
jgi:hypothetical protein